MSVVNKKMLLCAASGGTIEDYDRMMLIKDAIIARCVHTVPNITCMSSLEFTEPPALINHNVQLQKIVFDRQAIGWVGRCPGCGKIYYREAE